MTRLVFPRGIIFSAIVMLIALTQQACSDQDESGRTSPERESPQQQSDVEGLEPVESVPAQTPSEQTIPDQAATEQAAEPVRVEPQAARIMVVGDSISAGWKHPSYRMPLYNSLISQDCDVDMVGDQTLTTYQFYNSSEFPGADWPSFPPDFGFPASAHWSKALNDDTDHQAFPGIQTDEIANGVSGLVQPVAEYVARERPDYVLLQSGVNDMNRAIIGGMSTPSEIDAWAAETVAEIELIVNRSLTAHPFKGILIGNYIPDRTTVTAGQAIATEASAVYESKLEAMVKSRRDPRILIVDVANGFDRTEMTWDGLHPNAVGEEHIAGAFLPVLRSAGLCAEFYPEILSPHVGASVSGASTTITWDNNGVNADRWRVYVGSTQSGNSSTYDDSGFLSGTSRSVTVSGLPADDSNTYVALEYRADGITDVILSSFVSEAGVASEGSGIVRPAAGSILPAGITTFHWESDERNLTQFWVRIGSTERGDDYYDSGRIFDVSQRSVVVDELPKDGSTVYVRFQWKTPFAPWSERIYSYIASDNGAD